MSNIGLMSQKLLGKYSCCRPLVHILMSQRVMITMDMGMMQKMLRGMLDMGMTQKMRRGMFDMGMRQKLLRILKGMSLVL
jgi:hypothetical protein